MGSALYVNPSRLALIKDAARPAPLPCHTLSVIGAPNAKIALQTCFYLFFLRGRYAIDDRIGGDEY